VAVRFVYEVYGFIDGGSRMVTASTLEQAKRIEQAMNADPNGSHFRTVTKSITTREEKRTSFMDILLGIAVIVGILYGIGAL
jgi:hypothetical protein